MGLTLAGRVQENLRELQPLGCIENHRSVVSDVFASLFWLSFASHPLLIGCIPPSFGTIASNIGWNDLRGRENVWNRSYFRSYWGFSSWSCWTCWAHWCYYLKHVHLTLCFWSVGEFWRIFINKIWFCESILSIIARQEVLSWSKLVLDLFCAKCCFDGKSHIWTWVNCNRAKNRPAFYRFGLGKGSIRPI
jgi:hypothetical protein